MNTRHSTKIKHKVESQEFYNKQYNISKITSVILYITKKEYVIEGINIPKQTIKFDEYQEWNTIKNIDNKSIMDCQIDDDEIYSFQYVNLIVTEDNNITVGNKWNSFNVIIK